MLLKQQPKKNAINQSPLAKNGEAQEILKANDASDIKVANDEVKAKLKAQQEFALYHLQEKSNRLRASLAELRSGESKKFSESPCIEARGSCSRKIATSKHQSRNWATVTCISG
ncbi:hypothetical protein [Nostoc piscinale]|uniref:hypothetical protein n=1 Tax=Nostoc piscinale TaxID=224012 RepID=UPI003AB07328